MSVKGVIPKAGYTTLRTNKAFEVAEAMMKRRNMEFNETEAKILEHVFEYTQKWRNFKRYLNHWLGSL